jgi:hypothetical protein
MSTQASDTGHSPRVAPGATAHANPSAFQRFRSQAEEALGSCPVPLTSDGPWHSPRVLPLKRNILMTTKGKIEKLLPADLPREPAAIPPAAQRAAATNRHYSWKPCWKAKRSSLLRKAIKIGLAGNVNALRLCLDRLPAPKDRPIQLSLPPIENVQRVSSAISTVLEATGDGRITPGEGEILVNILQVQHEVLTTGDLERRVEQLEQARATDKNKKADQDAADLVQRLNEGRSLPEVNQ